MAFGSQIASLFATIGADTSGLEKGLDKTKKDLGGLKSDFDGFAKGLTFAAVATAIGVVGKALKDTVDDWSAYNIEVDKGATATGMAADEYSRIIQAADDARVSQEAMTKAMELATKNGYPMSIEALGTIADKLKAIKDPSEKAKLATEIFGRGWADIMPFLDKGKKGIEDMTAAVAENMIATEESIASSQAYATKVDDLTDAWTGFKNEVGGAVMPVLTDVMNAVTDTINAQSEFIDASNAVNEMIDNGTITQEEYSAALQDTEYPRAAVEALYEAHKDEYEQLLKSKPAVDDLAGSYQQSAAIMKAYEQNQKDLATQAAETAQKFREQKSAVTSLDKNFGGIISLAKSFDKSLEEIVKQEKIMRDNPIGSEKYVDAKGKVDELKQSMQDLANQVVLDMFQATIAIGGITEAEADAYFQMAEDMGVISKGAADAAKDAYGRAIDYINGRKIDDKTGNVKMNVDDSQVRAWTAKDFTAWVKMKRDSVEIDKWLDSVHYTTVKMRTEMTNEFRADGGPVASDTIYTVGERGPEVFVPASNGYILNHDDAMRIASNSGGNSGGNSGVPSNVSNVTNNYNLTMPTSNNPADIKTAFELLEAWA